MLKEYSFAASAWTYYRGDLALRTIEIYAVKDLLHAETAVQIAHDDYRVGLSISCGHKLKAPR